MFSAVLAGGKSSRMLPAKGLLEIAGRPMIGSVTGALLKAFGGVVISTNEPERYFGLGLPLVGDVYPEKGPMGGIFSVLFAFREDAFVAGCDMPFIKPALARAVAERMRRAGAEAAVPLWKGRPEPLLAAWSVNCLARMEACVSTGETGLQAFLGRINTIFLAEEEVLAADPEGASFFNVNTPGDLDRAVASMKGAFHTEVKK